MGINVISCFQIIVLSCFCGQIVKSQSAFRSCHLLYPKESCFALHLPLKTNLLSEYRNIYALQQAFYPIGKFATDRLVNVLYSVEFTENVLFDDQIPLCDGVRVVNVSSLSSVQFLTGWSSSGVFNIISPLQLSRLQLQLSNHIYNLFVIPGSGIYLPERFGWVVRNQQEQLVDLEMVNLVNINITVDNVSCVPDYQLIKSVLQDLTIMLKVWASTEGLIPQEINEDMLGYTTEPGFEIEGVDNLLEFDPFFAVLITTISFLLGISVIAVLGTSFPTLYGFLANGRSQFRFYFFAASISSFLVNIAILVSDFVQVPHWCSTSYFNYVTSTRQVGCDGTIIVKMIYFVLAIFLSLLGAGISSRSYEILFLQNERLQKHEKLIYIMCSWCLILSAGLISWSLVPTILQSIVYTTVILSITFIMIATVFWFTVLFTIPPLFVHNLHRKAHCLNIYFYLSPIMGLVVVVFVFGLVTISYLNAIVFGTYIGGVIGLVVATVPSILLTVLTEFYRDWFLTRTTNPEKMNEQEGEKQNESIEMPQIMSTLDSETGIGIPEDDDENQARKKTSVLFNIPRLPTVENHLQSTGEPPGFLKKRIQNLSLHISVPK